MPGWSTTTTIHALGENGGGSAFLLLAIADDFLQKRQHPAPIRRNPGNKTVWRAHSVAVRGSPDLIGPAAVSVSD